jgi:GT2 family glycosyltransferase
MENSLSVQVDRKSSLHSAIAPAVIICVTTRNRSEELSNCLNALKALSINATLIVVSDDSPDQSTQDYNRFIVQAHENAVYIVGPRRGVCANRNNALRFALTRNPVFVSFVDDDICLDSLFIENALNFYKALPNGEESKVILTGIVNETAKSDVCASSKLTFRGYFTPASKPEVVNICAATFPSSLFKRNGFDENIFFGYEDAELCLRAIQQGFKIRSLPSLISYHSCPNGSTLMGKTSNNEISQHQIHLESARLYVGIKRYKYIRSSPILLAIFLGLYFSHMVLFLMKRGELNKLGAIIKNAKLDRLIHHDIRDTL